MPATIGRYSGVGARERMPALAAAAIIQLVLGLALLAGLKVPIGHVVATFDPLIDVRLRPPPVRPRPRPPRPAKPAAAAAPRAPIPAPPSGSPDARAIASSHPIAPHAPPALPAGGASGALAGSGAGGGTGGAGAGDGDDGGTDLVQIAGAILPSDYPRGLRERKIGGRVGVLFTVGVNGRVTACSVTRPSGVPELDNLTCRLIRERFVYRPSTDRFGRPVADEVEGEHDWLAGGR